VRSCWDGWSAPTCVAFVWPVGQTNILLTATRSRRRMNMSRYVLGIVVAVVLAGLAGGVHADTMNILTNSDCAASGGAWSFIGPNTGYSTGDGRPHSIYMQYTHGASNVTSQPIAAGDAYSLTWDAVSTDDRSGLSVSQLAKIVYLDGTDLVEIASTTAVMGAVGVWQSYGDLGFTAVAGQSYIGKQVGVVITTSVGTWTDYTDIDNVVLNRTTSPEPGTLTLLAAGLLGLLAYAWRKRR
jgi:hypothetical protein